MILSVHGGGRGGSGPAGGGQVQLPGGVRWGGRDGSATGEGWVRSSWGGQVQLPGGSGPAAGGVGQVQLPGGVGQIQPGGSGPAGGGGSGPAGGGGQQR